VGHVRLRLLDGAYAVCRLADDAEVPPAPALGAEAFWSLTVARGERSLVCREADAPAGGTVVGGWRLLEVEGPMDLALTGVMAALSTALADAGVPIFAIATHDTDWILVPGGRLDDARAALRAAGHAV
jgi:uncharacterized protein